MMARKGPKAPGEGTGWPPEADGRATRSLGLRRKGREWTKESSGRREGTFWWLISSL